MPQYELVPSPSFDVAERPPAFLVQAEERRQRRQQRRQVYEALLDAIYSDEYGQAEKAQWQDLWDAERDRWLSGFASAHTRDAYSRSLREFKAFLRDRYAIDWLWMAEPMHASEWINQMATDGALLTSDPRPLAKRTINQRVAALSSYFQRMERATKLVDGEQVGLFVAANGHPRKNPFGKGEVERPKVIAYGQSHPIPTRAMQWILRRLAGQEDKTVAEHRDFALLYWFYRTGWRADSVLRLKWGDFRPKANTDGWQVYWRGKRGKEKWKSVPPPVWNAMLAYLRADGRFVPGQVEPQDDEYIWQPVRTHGDRNLTVQRMMRHQGLEAEEAARLAASVEPEGNRHISASTATEVLRRHLTRYFTQELRTVEGMGARAAREKATVRAAEFHLHSLRHTAANEAAQATKDDIRLISEFLDHESIETTRIYIEAIKEPEDKVASMLMAQFEF